MQAFESELRATKNASFQTRGLVLTYPWNCYRCWLEIFLYPKLLTRKRSWLCWYPQIELKMLWEQTFWRKNKKQTNLSSLAVKLQCWRRTWLMYVEIKRIRGTKFRILWSTEFQVLQEVGESRNNMLVFHPGPLTDPWCPVLRCSKVGNLPAEVGFLRWIFSCSLSISAGVDPKGLALMPTRLATLRSWGAWTSSSLSTALMAAPFMNYVQTEFMSTGSQWKII